MPETIDLITLSPSGLTVILVMAEVGPWDGSKDRLYKIQSRFNSYLNFALDGELARRFPEYVGRSVRVRIDCDHAPDAVSRGFLERLQHAGESHGVALSVELLPNVGQA